MIERYNIPGAVAPRGPYSHAVRAGDFIFVSGQGPLDPATNDFSFGSIEHEMRVVLNNIKLILEAAGSSLSDVVKCSVFLRDGGDFAAMNAVYGEYFHDPAPARATVQAARLPRDVRVEIDCIACVPR